MVVYAPGHELWTDPPQRSRAEGKRKMHYRDGIETAGSMFEAGEIVD